MFKQGLRKGLHWTILQRDPMPVTLNDWQATARRKVQRRRLVFASLGPCGGDFLSTRQNRRRDPLRRPQGQQPQRDPDAMDIDMVSFGGKEEGGGGTRNYGNISKEERQKRFSKGRCFQCGRQGHQKKNCQNRSGGSLSGGKGGPRKKEERARVIDAKTKGQINQNDEQVEKNDNAPGPAPNYNPTSVIDYMRTLNPQEQDDFLDRVMGEGMGF